ncbi:MAG: hypothetical protein QNK23_16370 [Crocinitomicaceae bacterium]|nr:hypothetical protein [Crocinitomicaceae bacterium]
MNDYLRNFINKFEVEPNRLSSLKQAIKDARYLTNRNLETGGSEETLVERDQVIFNPYSFIGIVNYYLVLDIIGSVFCLKSSNYSNENPIEIALNDFTDLQPKEVGAIKALRNCLAHSYSLINIPTNPRKIELECHAFTIVNSYSAPLTKFPKKPWTGNYAKKEVTEIGYGSLVDQFEKTITSLTLKFDNNQVEFRLENGLAELNKKYTVKTK